MGNGDEDRTREPKGGEWGEMATLGCVGGGSLSETKDGCQEMDTWPGGWPVPQYCQSKGHC